MRWQQYQIMGDVGETVGRLADYKGRARIVAGGTDLMVQIREMKAQEEGLVLLDVTQVEDMRRITADGSDILLGAAATMTEIMASPLIKSGGRALAQGAGWLGSPQIRNVATAGGNVVNAQPAGDTTVPLVALGAVAHVVSPNGERDVAVEDLFLGVGKSEINPSRELITHFRFPACDGSTQASAMQRLAKRKAFTLPQLAAAVRIELDETGRRFERVRIAAAPVTIVPWRAKRAEDALTGAPVSLDEINRAAALAREDANPRNSIRGGAEYRKDMVDILVRRALVDALTQLNKVPHD